MTSPHIHRRIREALDHRPVDVVLSDMAHSFLGNRVADVARVQELCAVAFTVACQPGMLAPPHGRFVCKVLQGEGTHELKEQLAECFADVVYCKPEASRKESTEMYLVCTGFRGPPLPPQGREERECFYP